MLEMRKIMLALMAVLVIGLTSCKKDDEKNDTLFAAWKFEKAVNKTDSKDVLLPENEEFIQMGEDGKLYNIIYNKGIKSYTKDNYKAANSLGVEVNGNEVAFNYAVLNMSLRAGTFTLQGKNQLRIDATRGEGEDYYFILTKSELNFFEMFKDVQMAD